MDAPERTAYLGRYDQFEAEVVIELLREEGIFAAAKHELSENDHIAYSPTIESDRGVVMVDADRVEEARAVVQRDLPAHLESIREQMEAIERGEQDPLDADDEAAAANQTEPDAGTRGDDGD